MANALANLFTDIADSIRSKTGSTEKLSPSEFASQIDSISVGGGGAEGCATVTFMNGDNVLLTRPVYIGDDCPDPVTQGRIETPTKESTVQYHYTHSGWTSVDGGTADSSVLKNITEDKVVYSAYTSTVSKYTITYYDEDGVTVLHTEQLGYGSVPNYMPTKDGFAFDKWTPTPVAVTGNASYTASWASVLASGTCGDTVVWALSADYTLTISGTGDMKKYYGYDVPWIDYVSQITAVNVLDGVTSIGNYAFNGCTNLTSIDIPNSVTSIGALAFKNCTNLTSIDIPNSVTSIGDNAFNGCTNLTSVNIPDGVTSIAIATFWGCSSLTSITIPDSVTSIDSSAFRNCSSLTSITIPNGVTNAGHFTFYGCSDLTSINIPNGVTSIGNSMFYNCTALTILILRSETMCTAGTNVLVSTPIASGTGYIYVPSALLSSYQSATDWSTYSAQFRALENYTVDGTITGELDTSKT